MTSGDLSLIIIIAMFLIYNGFKHYLKYKGYKEEE